MNWPDMNADCARCTGLCCAAYPFLDLDRFAYEKPADKACRHLAADCRCAIHDNRKDHGFKGCIDFDCHGAGQRIASEIFKQIDWRKSDISAHDIFSAFRALTRIHAALAQLSLLKTLPFDEGQRQRFEALFFRLNPDEGWSEETLADFPAHKAEKEVQDFAVSLLSTPAGAELGNRLSGK